MSEVKERGLHLEERPTSFKTVVGQPSAVAQLQGLAKSPGGLPHCLLFTGPSGCGKTTLARIVRKKLACGDRDFFEINAADSRGIETVRAIQQRVGLSPLDGETRVWLIDECHALTGDAQSAFLKLLEEPPPHAYFMLATTHPEKLRAAIQTRCIEIKVRALTVTEISALVNRVCEERDKKLTEDVVLRLADVADGSARKALNLLQQIMELESEEVQIQALENADAKVAAIEIARAIMSKKSWKDVCAILAKCDEEPESIRWMILSYFGKVATGGGRFAQDAIHVLECFQYNYYDTKKAGLILSCYNALHK